MSRWAPYLGLAIPALLAITPFNIVAFSWGFHHENQPMPHGLALKSQKIDRYAPYLKDGLFLLIVLSLAIHYSLPLSQIGLRLNGWQSNLLIGFLAGVLQAGFQRFVWKLLGVQKGYRGDRRLFQASGVQWVTSNLLSVSAEEFWMAFCLVTLGQTGHSTVTSVFLTAAVFGAAHFQYRLGALATGLYGAVFASLFLWRGSLLPSYLMHYIGNVSALYWARRALGTSVPSIGLAGQPR